MYLPGLYYFFKTFLVTLTTLIMFVALKDNDAKHLAAELDHFSNAVSFPYFKYIGYVKIVLIVGHVDNRL